MEDNQPSPAGRSVTLRMSDVYAQENDGDQLNILSGQLLRSLSVQAAHDQENKNLFSAKIYAVTKYDRTCSVSLQNLTIAERSKHNFNEQYR